MNYLVIIFSILPIFLLILYFYKKDTLKEPKKLLQKLFFSGFLVALIVIVVSLITIIFFPSYQSIENKNLIQIFIYSLIFIALIEETCKFLMVYKLTYNHEEFDQFYDIILYSVLVSLGFACIENILYVLENSNSLFVAIFRGITAVPAHACLGTFMGYYLALSKYEKKRTYFYLSLIIPVLLHGIYDFLLLSGNIILACIFLVFLVSMFIISILKIKKAIQYDKNMLLKNSCPNCKILITNNYCPNCGYKK